MATEARIPSPYSVNGPGSLRPSGPGALQVDTSGLSRGIDRLGAGITDLGGSMAQMAADERKKQTAVDFARAEAKWTAGALDIGNRFDQDNDHQTFAKRSQAETEKLKAEAAALIRDPEARAAWEMETEIKRLHLVDAVGDRGRKLQQQEERTNLELAIEDTAAMITEPTVPESVRNKARADLNGTLQVGVAANIITPAEAATMKRKYLQGAEEQLAVNRFSLEILVDPIGAQSKLGVASAMGGHDIATAAAAASGGVVLLEPGVAAMAAERLGDEAFPSDPALAEAYLTDPDMNARYAGAAMDMLTERYKGDLTAAVVASAPDGGTELADKWVKSGHNEDVLPDKVRDHLRDVMGRVSPEADMVRRPVVAEPGVDLAGVDVAVLDRFEKLQSVFGATLPVTSGYRDHAHNKEVGGAERSQHLHRRALDIDVTSLSKEERVRFIETASAMGFTGIGVGTNIIHLDTGSRRAWGYKTAAGGGDVPAWAADAIAKHRAGDVTEIPMSTANVAPEYRALSFDQRVKLYADARTEADRQALDMRAGLDIAVQNAPAAIMATGGYDRTMPMAEDFVQAYGAAEGIELFKAFDASVDVAENAYAMRTLPADDILAMVEDATPTSAGDMAQVETQRFETVSQAAATVIKAREEDPAGYTLNAFPSVAAAWEDIGDDPDKFAGALSAMAAAQQQLGIDDMRLLPKKMADGAAAMFNNAELSLEERIGAVTGLALATQDEDQQAAIFSQLVDAGVPVHAQGAMAALSRGDTKAAGFLFRAAVTDPDKLPGKLEESTPNINLAIQELLFDENSIGDVIYGVTNGTAENYERLAADTTLIQRAVKLRLLDNSANSLEEAVRLTAKDMWGDVDVVTGKGWGDQAGLKITVPKGTDTRPLHRGFDALLATAEDAMRADMVRDVADAPTSTGEAQILKASIDNYVEEALAEGYFTNAGNGSFTFIDPYTGTSIDGPDGEPMTFTMEEVLEAGAVAEAASEVLREDVDAFGFPASNFNPFGAN